jgi:hypothetical protein
VASPSGYGDLRLGWGARLGTQAGLRSRYRARPNQAYRSRSDRKRADVVRGRGRRFAPGDHSGSCPPVWTVYRGRDGGGRRMMGHPAGVVAPESADRAAGTRPPASARRSAGRRRSGGETWGRNFISFCLENNGAEEGDGWLLRYPSYKNRLRAVRRGGHPCLIKIRRGGIRARYQGRKRWHRQDQSPSGYP